MGCIKRPRLFRAFRKAQCGSTREIREGHELESKNGMPSPALFDGLFLKSLSVVHSAEAFSYACSLIRVSVRFFITILAKKFAHDQPQKIQ